jgi:hypothetical protein
LNLKFNRLARGKTRVDTAASAAAETKKKGFRRFSGNEMLQLMDTVHMDYVLRPDLERDLSIQ